jgi:copper(I)-binding protein
VIRSGWAGALPRRLVLVAAAALIPLLAGCEAGNNAPTLEFHYPTDTAGTAVGNLSIRNVFVLGAALGSSLRPGQNAGVFLSLINEGAPDRLVSISAPGSASSVVLPAGGVPVVDQRPAFLSGPSPVIYLKDLTRTLNNGTDITLVLNFAKLGPVSLEVPVMPRATHFATYAPPPSPSATVKPHGKAASASPSPSATS